MNESLQSVAHPPLLLLEVRLGSPYSSPPQGAKPSFPYPSPPQGRGRNSHIPLPLRERGRNSLFPLPLRGRGQVRGWSFARSTLALPLSLKEEGINRINRSNLKNTDRPIEFDSRIIGSFSCRAGTARPKHHSSLWDAKTRSSLRPHRCGASDLSASHPWLSIHPTPHRCRRP